MQLQISTLQSQLTLLQHQNRPELPTPTQGLNGADVSCISELRAELHAIKSVVAATPPPASAAASVWQMPPGTGSRHGSRSDVPQPTFPIAPSVGRQPSAPSPTHHSSPSTQAPGRIQKVDPLIWGLILLRVLYRNPH